MSQIQILPDVLSNKIAAGEVVERPASVVKELLENAIDAGSARIFVDIENGGRSLIRVSDNGTGMGRDDALLSIERYATSKIKTDQDLFSIQTLGFRGEALPSIASVSRFSLTTRDAKSETGTLVEIHGGTIRNVTEVGAPMGTLIEVKNLFYNTPARRKFLKSTNTEMGHIVETVAGIALGRADITFQLTHNGKKIKTWPATPRSLDRVSSVLGQGLRKDLYPISAQNQHAEISGYISAPQVTRSTSQKIYLYVNGRYIRDRGLQHALFEGYRGRLMKGRFPIAVLFIQVPHTRLDVNVHPTKHEVRFAGYRHVYETLKTAVHEAWDTIDHRQFPPVSRQPDSDHLSRKKSVPSLSENRFATVHKEQPIPFPEKQPETGFATPEPQKAVSAKQITETKPPFEPQPARPIEMPEPVRGGSPIHRKPQIAPETPLRIIGQLFNTYIVCEAGRELVLFDQHAAHERILFEIFQFRSRQTPLSVQKLLIPEILDLGYRESDHLEKLIPGLQRLGFEIEPFGGNSFAVKTVPSLLADREITPLVTEIIERTSDIGFSQGMDTILDECRIRMACHGSIRANQALSQKEMQHLIQQLQRCQNPAHCPHGRPIRVSWPLDTLKKLFKRIV